MRGFFFALHSSPPCICVESPTTTTPDRSRVAAAADVVAATSVAVPVAVAVAVRGSLSVSRVVLVLSFPSVRPSFLPSFLPSSPCFDVDPTEPYLSSSPLSLRLRGRRGGEREGGEKGGSSRGERGKEKKTSRKIPPQKSLTLCSIREGKRGQKKSVLGATCSLHLIKHSIRVGRPFFRSRCSPFAAAAAATAAVVSPSGSAVAFTAVFPTERERERRERREEALFLPPRHSSSSFLLQ